MTPRIDKAVIPLAIAGALVVGVKVGYDSVEGDNGSTTHVFIFVAPKEIPGTLNHSVTQRTVNHTICVSGYTKTIRPSSSYTTTLKIKQMKKYDLPGTTSNYEEDHLVPLELGGAPSDPKNLWPEPHSRSFKVDAIENKLHRLVCDGVLKLRAARKEIKRIKHELG